MKRVATVIGALILGWISLETIDRALPPPLDTVESSVVVTDAEGLPLRAFPVAEGRWRLQADLEKIDERFIEALLLVEDKRFFDHGGTDLLAVLRAARDNILQQRVVSGASTITMQTARLLEPRPRTLPSKVVEALRAWQIERRLTKDEILELYLTLTPYGGNLEGVRTAAFSYFGSDTEQLTDSEIALLLALPQSPEARRPDLRPEAALTSRNTILARLATDGWIAQLSAEEATTDPLPDQRLPFPSDAWHLAETITRRAAGSAHTNVDRHLQTQLEAILSEAAAKAGPQVQAAGLIVRVEDRAVLASVGSASLEKPGGWLDLTQSRRSPGSTLKPFVYALAMQEGLVSPQTRVADIPTAFGSYAPENFERQFNGELTIATALQHSLNVPAVLVLDALGPDRLVGALRLSGVQAALPSNDAPSTGLAVALGGLGVNAQELAVLYAALADSGIAKPLAFTANEAAMSTHADGVRLMSADAAQNISAILRESPSPAGRLPADLSINAPRIAFKTGTSYGFRDAWAAGHTDQHVVVIWFGRADGAPRPGQTGRQAALPLLFDVFDTIAEPIRAPEVASHAAEHGPTQIAQETGPVILFPPDGATLWPKQNNAPLVLAGRADGEAWFVSGQPLKPDAEGNIAWSPTGPGFYTITLADSQGRRASSTIRMR